MKENITCKDCALWLKSCDEAIKNYYTDLPFHCFGEEGHNEDFTNNIPSCFRPKIEEEFEDERCASLFNNWVWSKDLNMVVLFPKAEWEVAFEKGFFAGIKLSEEERKPSCNNCHNNAKGVLSFCKKTELCKDFILDYFKYFKKSFYSSLCDTCCIANECKEKKEINYRCDNWVRPEEKKEQKRRI
jgi:hypothetical protein